MLSPKKAYKLVDHEGDRRIVAADIWQEKRSMHLRMAARVHAQQRLVAQGYGVLFDGLKESLYSYDPLHLNLTEVARDEYGSPISTIIPRLEYCSSPEHLRFLVEEEMSRHYPTADIANTDWATLAFEWWNRWCDFQKGRQYLGEIGSPYQTVAPSVQVAKV